MCPGIREIVVVVVALAVAASSAQAVPGDEAEALIQQGLTLRRSGKDFEALTYFQRALALASTPRSNAQLGLAEQALAHWVESEQHLDTALAAQEDAWIRKNRTVLETSLATVRSHIGQVEVTGEPAGASVRVNGGIIGTLPLAQPIRANEGYLEVDVQAAGCLPAHRTLTVRAGQAQRLFVRLEADAPAPIAALTPLAARAVPPETEHHPMTERVRPASDAADSGRTLRALGIGAGGLGVLGLVGGIWMSVRVKNLKHDVEAGNSDPQLQTDGRRAEKLQWVGYGVGAGALAAGGILYYLGSQKESAVSFMPLPKGALASIRGRMW